MRRIRKEEKKVRKVFAEGGRNGKKIKQENGLPFGIFCKFFLLGRGIVRCFREKLLLWEYAYFFLGCCDRDVDISVVVVFCKCNQ